MSPETMQVGTGPMTGAEVIARVLTRAGARFAFGIPGGEVLAMVGAMHAAGMRITTARHENAAGFMAEGTWHATGAPGVLFATIGPGVTNTVNVAAHCLEDRVPLVILSGSVEGAGPGGFTHQALDHVAVLAPVTKRSLRARARSLERDVEDAVRLSLTEPLGPVHIDVSTDIAERGSEDVAENDTPIEPPRAEPPLDEHTRRAIDEAVAGAERPLVIAGLEVVTTGASGALARFVERTGAPCLTTYKAKGCIDEHGPLALGAAGLSPHADAILLRLVRAADVVVLVGYDPIEMRRPWQHPFGAAATVIELTAAPPSHGMHRSSIAVTGPLGAWLDALETEPKGLWPEGEPSLARAALARHFAPESGLGPYRIAHVIDRALGPDAVLTVDTGAHRIALAQVLACNRPRAVLQSSGFCTMGYALPVAIGHKLAAPSRPVVAVMGDGGLDMVLGELLTARDLGVPVVAIVIDDASLALIEIKQRAMGLPNVGVDSGRTAYGDIARAMGIEGRSVRTADELAEAIRNGVESGRCSLVHVPIDRRAYDDRL